MRSNGVPELAESPPCLLRTAEFRERTKLVKVSSARFTHVLAAQPLRSAGPLCRRRSIILCAATIRFSGGCFPSSPSKCLPAHDPPRTRVRTPCESVYTNTLYCVRSPVSSTNCAQLVSRLRRGRTNSMSREAKNDEKPKTKQPSRRVREFRV